MKNLIAFGLAGLVVLLFGLTTPSQTLAGWSIGNCPGARTFSHCATATLGFVAIPDGPGDPGEPISWSVNLGTIVSTSDTTATWSWNTMPQAGFPTLQVVATDQLGAADTCTVELAITNAAPTISCPSTVLTISGGDCKSITLTATDDCDPLVWYYVSYPGWGWDGTITVDDGVFTICPSAACMYGEYTFTALVSDGLAEAACEVTFRVTCCTPLSVKIEKIHNQLQGQFVDVDLTLMAIDPAEGLGGFDFLIAYDNSALSFQLAGEGDIYDECGWEYFTYRFGPNGNCGNGCPSGLTRIVGIAETNNGAHHPTCYGGVGTLPVTLAYLRFLVSNDRSLECQYVPVRFFWIDCGDNSWSNASGDKLFISAAVFDYYDGITWPRINDGTADFPSFLGAQDVCLTYSLPNKPLPIRYVDFYNGGIDIACADSIDARGDLNLNGIAYEIADAVMFSNYFVQGLGAFGDYPQGAIAASDVNADGTPLTVADLVYLIRVIVGDALPYPKTAPISAGYAFEDGTLSIDAEMGAAYLVFDGSVSPALLASNMTMEVGERYGQTHVLVYRDEANQTFSGAFLQANGTLVKSEFATYEGQMVVAHATTLPKSFALRQNYPNPFNPVTSISFELPQAADVSLDVFNTSGQHVATLISGRLEAGEHTAEWDATGFASGIYMYRLQAGDYSDTRKMVLLK